MSPSEFFESLYHLLYPSICQGCNRKLLKGERVLCLQCENALKILPLYTQTNNVVEQKFYGRVNIQRAASMFVFVKHGLLQHLIHQLKYKSKKEIGIYLGEKYGALLKTQTDYATIDCIVPVPIHPERKVSRGYNQCDLIAEGLSKSLNIPVYDSIIFRKTHKESQTKKSRKERWKNVAGDFYAPELSKLAHKHVLLVDDVITTGATLDACANLLLQSTEVKVSIVTLAVVIQT